MSQFAPETVHAFRYIGGQEEAVRRSMAIVEQERTGHFPGKKPLILFTGPAGIGKTAFTVAVAEALGATLVAKRAKGFLVDYKGFSHLQKMDQGYDEARTVAPRNPAGRAVYTSEGLDVVMGVGEPEVNSEIFIEMMDRWSKDLRGGVLVAATAIDYESLRPPVLRRFRVINLERPDQTRIIDVINKGTARLSELDGRSGLFGELGNMTSLAERMVELGWVTGDVNDFLREAIAVAGGDRPIDTPFLMDQMPPTPKKAGFASS